MAQRCKNKNFHLNDENLTKTFAVKYGFSADEIKLAKRYGLEDAAKYSVMMHSADPETVELFDPENPNDVYIISQLSSIELSEPFLYDERWSNSSVLSWARDTRYVEKLLILVPL